VQRKINPSVASQLLNEVYYEIEWREFFGVGFYNDSNGLEVNNQYYKTCIGKKDITPLDNDAKTLVVFEWFFDFLSYASLSSFSNKNVVVLNSVSLVNKVLEHINQSLYTHIELYLDNDDAWKKAAQFLKE
jgi:hypothetical protein